MNREAEEHTNKKDICKKDMYVKDVIRIRKMLPKDLVQVCEIERQAFSIPWSKRAFEDSLKLPHAIFLVAYLEEQILGYCGVYQVFNEGDITNIAVSPDYRGMGIAGKLLEEVFVYSAERGIGALTLEVRESNAPAIHLYHKYGFEQAGLRKNFYEKPKEHAIIMWKRGIADKI